MIILIKIIAFIYIINFTTLGGQDADFYNEYALGIHDNNFVNIWPKILLSLNNIGLYDREVFKYILLFLSTILIPLQFSYLISKNVNKYFLIQMIFIEFYPMLFYWSIDIYRETVMISLFLFYLYILNIYINNTYSKMHKYFLCILMSTLIYIEFLFRPYFGASLFISLLFYKFLKNKLLIFIFVLNILIVIFYLSGFLDPLINYRENVFNDIGNTNLNISFYNKDIIEFIFLFYKSLFAQAFGIFFPNLGSVILFTLESIPFIFSIFYIYINRKYLTYFEYNLILFSIVYSLIFVIGNDNLGTALRIRIPMYISIYLISFKLFIRNKQKGNLYDSN